MIEYMTIAEAKERRGGVNIKATVKSKSESRTVNLKSGGTVNVCDAVIYVAENQDDVMNLTLWGEDIDKVNVNDTVVITDGYTNTFKGEASLTKGKFGKMAVNPEPDI